MKTSQQVPKKKDVTVISVTRRKENFGRRVTCNMACRIDRNGTVLESTALSNLSLLKCITFHIALFILSVQKNGDKITVTLMSFSTKEMLLSCKHSRLFHESHNNSI